MQDDVCKEQKARFALAIARGDSIAAWHGRTLKSALRPGPGPKSPPSSGSLRRDLAWMRDLDLNDHADRRR